MSSWVEYNTVLFTDVWGSYDEFSTDFENSAIANPLTSDNTELLFYLLYARYGNTPISAMDENQWKYRIYSIIFQYGPTWEKKLEIQKDIRNLSLAQIKKGTLSIYNKALNPETAPSTVDTNEIPYVNEQNVAKVEKNDSQAYAEWMSLLEEDVTEYFLRKFSTCFKKIVRPEKVLEYVTEEEQ